MKKLFSLGLLAAVMCAPACSSDSDEVVNNGGNNGNENNTPEVTTPEGKFVIATTVTGSGNTSYKLLTSDDLKSGSISVLESGLANDGATNWVFYGQQYLYALTYNQGNAGVTSAYELDANDNLQQRDNTYKVTRYTTYGVVGDNVMTLSTSDGLTSMADANGYLPKTIAISYLNTTTDIKTTNDTENLAYRSENFLGNGEYVTLAGLEEVNGKVFTAPVPMGLSQYGGAIDGGKYVLAGNEDLVKTEDGGNNSSKYYKGELQWTQYPNECWVAIYDDATMTSKKLIKTDKISYACGRYKSQYYQTIRTAENGDVYVFSPSFAKCMTDARQQTTLPAGVVRIAAGTTEFDSYYCNLEELTGGKTFMKVWNIGGTNFLLQMYDELVSNQSTALNLAVFNAEKKAFSYVSGLPADITALGNEPYVEGGVAYMAVSTDAGCAIYVINPTTGVATEGLKVEGASSINGIGRLTANK
jgi:hypothetical protein